MVAHVPVPDEGHTWSLTFVRVLVLGEGRMVTHARSCLVLREDHTWSLTPIGIRVSIPDENHTWLLMPVGVCAPREDRTWSLTPVGIHFPVLGEDRTWLLKLVSVQYLVFWEGYSLPRI